MAKTAWHDSRRLRRSSRADVIKRMFGVTTSDDYKPVTWVGRFPVHVATLLVAVHSLIMVITCFLMAFSAAAFLDLLVFDSAQVLGMGRVWQIRHIRFCARAIGGCSGSRWRCTCCLFSAAKWNVSSAASAFIILYALLVCVPTLFLTAGRPLDPVRPGRLCRGPFRHLYRVCRNLSQCRDVPAHSGEMGGAGSRRNRHAGALAGRDWASITVLWVSIATGFLFIRLRGIGPELVWWDNFKSILRPKPKFHVVPKSSARRVVEPEDELESIDPVLEKISKFGIGSLTAGERRALDRARARLLKKSK